MYINSDLTDIKTQSTSAKIVGKDADGNNIYEKVLKGTTLTNNQVLDSSLTFSAVKWLSADGSYTTGTYITPIPYSSYDGSIRYRIYPYVSGNSGLIALVENVSVSSYYFIVRYVLN